MLLNKEKKQNSYSPKATHEEVSDTEINKILRTVPTEKAFYFYKEIGTPTKHFSASLPDFRDKLKIIEWSSLVFHLKRRDFENWIREVIGDPELAKRISDFSPDTYNLRDKLYMAVDTRIRQLREPVQTATSEQLLVKPNLSEIRSSE